MFSLQKSRAFTLIELLVVVGIIALLVGIMVPAVQTAMDIAKDGVVKTQFHAIGVGLEMFKQDRLAGNGYYPESLYRSPQFPHDVVPGYTSLAIQLLGRDLRGYDPTDLYNTDPSSFRRDHYIKLETVQFADINPGTANDRQPVMLCKWGQPILYFRAAPGATATDDIETIYDPTDTLPGLEAISETDQENYWGVYHTSADNKDPLLDPAPIDFSQYGNFYNAITNTDLGIPAVPYNLDSFILWSAGKDQRYGTDDDIKNFED